MEILRDFRFAIRTLLKNPGFSLTIVATLALALGANAAVFSIVDALVLRPFPIPGIDRLVMIYETVPERGRDRDSAAPGNFLDWKRGADSLEGLVALRWWDANLSGDGQPERLQGTRVTPGFLKLLGVRASAGRLLATSDSDPSQERTVVLSHRFWTRRFGADPAMVGQDLLLNGESYRVVGVAQPDFEYPFGSEVWAPLVFDAEAAADRAVNTLQVIGRLKPGSTVTQAQQELDAIASRLAVEYPETNAGRGVRVLELARAVVDIGAPAFLAVWQATVVFVLLIACVNIAGLLLARGADRNREISLRAALGAGRFRIIRQLLTENLVMSLTGAVLALPLAWVGIDLLRSSMPARIRRFVVGWDQIDVDPRLMLFTSAIAVGATLLFGFLPALAASRPNLAAALHESGRSASPGPARQKARTLLVIGEVAVALMLLVASGLSVRGTLRMAQEDQGYDPEGIMTLQIELPDRFYPEPANQAQFFEKLLEGLESRPQIESAAATNTLPSSGSGWSRNLEIEGQPTATNSERPSADYRVVTPEFFSTMRIPVISGRGFNSGDREDGNPVAVVSAQLAERTWPGQDPIGRRLRTSSTTEKPWATVVGVVGDVSHDWFLGGPQPTLYLPMAQNPLGGMMLAIRTHGDPTQAVALAREEINRIDPNQPFFDVGTQTQLIWDRMLGLRYAAIVMAVFGVLALILAGVGLFGLMAYSVSRRTHEIGVRVALGAERSDVLALLLRRGVLITGCGIAIGLLLAWGAGRFMESTLFGTVRLDVQTYVVFALVLAAVSMLASYLPARRALKIDPSEALRAE